MPEESVLLLVVQSFVNNGINLGDACRTVY